MRGEEFFYLNRIGHSALRTRYYVLDNPDFAAELINEARTDFDSGKVPVMMGDRILGEGKPIEPGTKPVRVDRLPSPPTEHQTHSMGDETNCRD